MSLAGGSLISLFSSVHRTTDPDPCLGSLHLMVKYLNLEHTVLNIFFLKYRIKCSASYGISAQV